MSLSDLFPKKTSKTYIKPTLKPKKKRKHINYMPHGIDGISRFPYKDADSNNAICVIRKELADGKKIFSQWESDGKDGWFLGLDKYKNTLRPLFCLSGLIDDKKKSEIVIIHEGEKCVVAAYRAKLKGVHTTSSGGAGGAKKTDWQHVKDRVVYISPDNNEAGEKYLAEVLKLALDAGAVSVCEILLPNRPDGGDVADWLDAGGATKDWEQLMSEAKKLGVSDNQPATQLDPLSTVAKALPMNEKALSGDSMGLNSLDSDGSEYPLTPIGYSCNKHGVFIEHEDKDPERLTHRPAWVAALSRDGACDNWGYLVCWVDHDRKKHERALPAALFHANGNELAQELATAGLPIVPSKERRLLQYLAAFTPDARLTAASSTGWHGKSFVMPMRTLNEPANERIIYQSTEYRDTSWMIKKGTLKDWQALVKDVSPLVKLSVAASLSAPIRHLTHIAAGGFHFFGNTSHGKTTVLQAAASVWGNGTDPAMSGGENAYIQRWNATRNGLEGMASCFNDLPLVVDEVGESDAKDFGRVIYQLMSGTGRTRANRNGGLSKRRTWRILLLSSGEVSVSDSIDNVKGGQLVRLIDIEAVGMFEDREDADRMKFGCSQHFGHAGIALLEGGDLLEHWGEFSTDSIGEAPTPETGRVRERFKLAAYVGELAIERGILPWVKGSVLEACQSIYEGWKKSSHATSDAERGIENIRSFLLSFGSSRFERSDDRAREPIDRAGSYSNGRYNFTPNAFKEACGGVLEKTVKIALKEAGFFHVDAVGRLNAWANIGGKRVRAVCVMDSVLSDIEKTGGTSGTGGTGGTTPMIPTVSACTSSKSEVVQPESVATKGFVPPVPPVPPVPLENAKLEKIGEIGRDGKIVTAESLEENGILESANKENSGFLLEQESW